MVGFIGILHLKLISGNVITKMCWNLFWKSIHFQRFNFLAFCMNHREYPAIIFSPYSSVVSQYVCTFSTSSQDDHPVCVNRNAGHVLVVDPFISICGNEAVRIVWFEHPRKKENLHSISLSWIVFLLQICHAESAETSPNLFHSL